MKWNVCVLGKKFKLMSTSYKAMSQVAWASNCSRHCLLLMLTQHTHFPNCNLRTWEDERKGSNEMWKWTLDNLLCFLTHACSHEHHSLKNLFEAMEGNCQNKIYFLRTWPLYFTYSLCWHDLQLVDSDNEMIRKME